MTTKRKKTKHTIESRPLTEKEISFFVQFYNKNKSFPGSKIPCIATGKLTTCIGPWMKKKIKEFGGVEDLLRNYKCREALKREREIIKPIMFKKRRNITKKLKDENKEWDIPKIRFTPPRPLTKAEISETTKTQCFRPDIFISNGRHCDGCPIFEDCKNRLKNLPKFVESCKKNIKKKSKIR